MRKFVVGLCALAAIAAAAVSLLMFAIMPDLTHETLTTHAIIYTMQAVLFALPFVFCWVGHLIVTRRL